MYKLLKDLFPICRSITGDGNRQTLKMLNQEIPIKIEGFQSGTQCYDWTIPDEWDIKEAYIENETGTRIVDFQDNNLHVFDYDLILQNAKYIIDTQGRYRHNKSVLRA